MKKMKHILAVVSVSVIFACMSMSTVSAYTKADICSSDDNSVTFYYNGADFDYVTIADTEENCRYIWKGNTGYSAVVMEDASLSVDEAQLLAISDTLTAIPAEDFEYAGRYCGEYGEMDLDDLDLSRTYIINSDADYDRSQLYKLSGVAEVYEMTGTAYTKGWVGGVNSNEGKYVLWVTVPEGTEFTAETCADLPYTVSAVEYKQTRNGLDSYDIIVEYDKNDSRYEDPKYKSIFDMQLAMLDMYDGNISVTTPLTHMMAGSGAEGLYLLTAIESEEDKCDLNQSGAPDLDDASLLLTHYANTAAGIAAASEADTSSYDVNGDGTVDLDDALKIVTVYAELAAGLR